MIDPAELRAATPRCRRCGQGCFHINGVCDPCSEERFAGASSYRASDFDAERDLVEQRREDEAAHLDMEAFSGDGLSRQEGRLG